MPHLYLEYTDNLLEKTDFAKLFGRCHEVLSEITGADIHSCKSRAFKIDAYCIGTGESNNAFVHLYVLLASGRTSKVKKKAGAVILSLLQEEFSQSMKELNLEITLFVDQFDREFYFKFPGSV